MTSAVVLLAILVTAGAVVAVSAREPRFAALGIIVTLVVAAFIADPAPGVAALGARVVGAALAGYLIWVALRGAPPPTTGWRVGWPGAAAVAMVAFVIGWLAAGSIGTMLQGNGSGPSAGVASALIAGSPVPRAALGAALALAALAAAPVLVGRDVLRLGLGLLLLLAAAELLRNAIGVRPDGLVELGLAVLTAAAGAALAGLIGRSLGANGDLLLRGPTRGPQPRDPVVRHKPVDDAHPGYPAPGTDGRPARPAGPAAHPGPKRDSGWPGVS